MKYLLTATAITSLVATPLLAGKMNPVPQPTDNTKQEQATQKPEKWLPGHTLDFAELPTEWLQGNAPTEFEKDTVYLIDLWKTPGKGPRSYNFFRKKPGYFGYELLERMERLGNRPDNIQLLTIAVNETSSPERVKKFLTLPVFQCDHPVANDGPSGTIYSNWLAPLGFRSFPHTLIVKNGVLLWSGDGTTIPESLVTQASRPEFDLDAYQAARKDDAELFKTMRKTTDAIWKASEGGASLEELNAMISKEEERLGHDPFMFMQLQELRFGLCLEHKDPAGALAAMNDAAHKFPDSSFIQGRVFKYLITKEELKPDSYPTIIHCMERQALLRDSEYASHCWVVIGDIYREMGKMDEATAAYEKGVALSSVQRRLETLQAGKPLPIAD
ncbi:tetratricopeptide repeat protein [Sulfuriroseicoccus oceanibius]|uniref:Uncharacterized protein n=1 Tax=Sulfuriroseicoccus oceanibius TaxID=2707525 RepID=A0A6B3LDQ5_9BACT|nr:tetratricopeptide repeat protein [Sulfuriroseicoccus oceanibius]QQL45205.1 hypothetical protein G3M56_001040 [Sulfuriroseicoccus oceanibius]